jgi:hypothetical protein
MWTMRIVCSLALPVGTLLCGPNGAGAQGTPDAHQACTPDAMRLCSEFIPDAERVKRCMLSRRSQLSPDCRFALIQRGETVKLSSFGLFAVRKKGQ